jgi:hypothetical protein
MEKSKLTVVSESLLHCSVFIYRTSFEWINNLQIKLINIQL